jgi:glycosyltransferase involved in cell wall biosynthesis
MYLYPTITLLITHYNRSASLERLLQAFSQLSCTFGEIVVSDDGSKSKHLNRLYQLKERFSFRLITTPVNRGLGHNINKGQDAVTTPLTLYVQEDFVPTALFPARLEDSVRYMEADTALDLVRYYAYFRYPYLRALGDGFSEMLFDLRYRGYRKFYMYSDHPHLRRTSFFTKFGRFSEVKKGDVAEYRMMISFLKNNGKALYFDDYQALFYQKNTPDEPSTMRRNLLRESDHFVIAGIRHLYRHILFNLSYRF